MSPVIYALRKEKNGTIPFWFMRQAGRYLPEYKAVRSHHSNFLSFCYHPEDASQVTLQPLQRFDMDAAIIFSDILVIPHALGQKVEFIESVGPVLSPIANQKDFETLSLDSFEPHLSKVYEAIKNVSSALPEKKCLIGFCGSPWTLASYMVQGKSSKDFSTVRQIALNDKDFFTSLMALLVKAVCRHAKKQIEAGAQVIQLFDSWAGVLSEKEFDRWVIAPTRQIVDFLKSHHPEIPIIGFPRAAGVGYLRYARETGVDGMNIDAQTPLDWAQEYLAPHVTLQGNLDPILLASDKENAVLQTKEILKKLGGNPFIFNLGHGIVPHTPIEHVEAVVKIIREYRV